MLVTKDLDKTFFEFIDPLGKTLASIAWSIRDSYYRNKMATQGEAVFVIDMIFSLVSVVDWQVFIAAKQQKVELDNFW